MLGEYRDAIQHFKDAVSISDRLGVPHQTVAARVHIAFSHWMLAEFKHADTSFEETLLVVNQMPESARFFPTVTYAEYLIIRGQYQEAKLQLQTANSIGSKIFLGHFLEGRLSRNLGWAALADRDYTEAKVQFQKSIQLFETNKDDEQIAWSQAGLARAEIGLGNLQEAKNLLMEALWTSIEMRAFIPLIFTLPVTVLYLADENRKEAKSILKQIRTYPLLDKAQFFKDIVDRYLPDEVSAVAPNDNETLKDPQSVLWATASKIMSNWMQVWMEAPIKSKQKNPNAN
jgi:tetratricopeptide (TPR) repeat protein